ncbi:MAG: hemolysin family protein [Fibrobacter sp.]|jgi:CBS domain containing-hemolysin-like protein|nr:hemolysin family protein [Fibrobacter sp.]
MSREQVYFILGILFLLGVSNLFSLVKVVFLIIHSKRAGREKTELESKISAFVETTGFNETISMGRTFCNVSSGLLGYRLFMITAPSMSSEWWWLLAYFLVAGFLIYTVSVFIPHLIGSLKPDTISVALPLVFRMIRFPFIYPSRLAHFIYEKLLKAFGYNEKFSFLSESQIDAIQSDMSSSEKEVLEAEERQMILNIFDFVETPVREIMTPRVDMCAIDVKTPLAETIRILNEERHSRLPVYQDSVDNVIGILSNRDFLEWYTEHGEEEHFDLKDLVMPAIFVPYHKKIDDLLRELRKQGNQLAMVVDEYGGIAGLVTIEDILEEIVGEIKDEDDSDEDNEIQRLKDGRFILDPLMTFSDLEDELGIQLKAPKDSHVETLSGLIQVTLGSIPNAGTEVVIDGFKFRVLQVKGTRMSKILMTVPPHYHYHRHHHHKKTKT